MNKKQKEQSAGFTLIELLVVISIIALISSMTMYAFTTARKKGRDTKRKQDLSLIQKALALYQSENGLYPPCFAEWPQHSIEPGWYDENVGGGYSCLRVSLKPYLAKMPVDPTNDWYAWFGAYSYSYWSTDDRRDYNLITNLESPNDPERCAVKQWKSHYSPPHPTAGSGGSYCNSDTSYYYYLLQNLYSDH